MQMENSIIFVLELKFIFTTLHAEIYAE